MADVRPLSPETWDAYEAMMERHNGVFGGCWCLGFHSRTWLGEPFEAKRARKRAMVEAGTTRAALAFDGDTCVAWVQYGRPDELPHIKGRKAWEAGQGGDGPPADWRLTCFFTDRAHRRAGVAQEALNGAVALIAKEGGGVAEGYPEALEGQKTAASFLNSGTLGLFERAGFTPIRKIGLHRWVVRKEIAPA